MGVATAVLLIAVEGEGIGTDRARDRWMRRGVEGSERCDKIR